ncbi:MAG: alpha-glucosidase/alpha-galactosidase [Clostridia bacterium]|nr:alpha-glucosidase/alpha-galactosidase [Clostridia bacterium]
MYYENKMAKDVKIAYIGGGSRGWAWTFMNDLAKAEDMAGVVHLYDIDYEAARRNEVIGNRFPGNFTYKAMETAKEAMTGVDFVVISILPGTFDEMEHDVHDPEKYGVYQSVGDTTGPGGFFRALRTVPMIREIARNVKAYCPDAFVINFTNPMAVCVKTLYKEFPEIKAYGCCHEVFGTQKTLADALAEFGGIKGATREEICVNVVGVNHFTWVTKAQYKNVDLFGPYRQFTDKYLPTAYDPEGKKAWLTGVFASGARVRLGLFDRFGVIGAAGDRHLAEFCDRDDFLTNKEKANEWTFTLTPVSFRKADLVNRLKRSDRLYNGEETWKLTDSGEEGVEQMRALLGLIKKVTNVNLPNRGQIANLPLGSVVETNAVFSAKDVTPVMAGEIPACILPLVSRANYENDRTVEAAFSEDLTFAYEVFAEGHLLAGLSEEDKKALFKSMYEGTKNYLGMYK